MMVFDRMLGRISDRAVKQFGFDGEDLPQSFRKSIMFFLYRVFPFIVGISLFAGTFVGMLFMERKFGIERVMIFVFAVYIYSRFSKSSKPTEER